MADEATFAIKMSDGVTGSANAAAGALDALQAQITEDEQALRSLESAMRSLQKASVVDVAAFRQMSSGVQGMRDKVAGAKSEFIGLGGVLGRKLGTGGIDAGGVTAAAKAAQAFNPKQWELAARSGNLFGKATQAIGAGAKKAEPGIKSAGHAAAESGAKIADFKDAIEGGGGTLPPFIKDLIEGTQALGPFGVAISATIGALGLLSIAGVALFKLGAAAISAQEELEGVSDEAIAVAKRTPIARAQVAALSTTLEKTGLKGQALEAALEKAVKKKYGKEAEKSMYGLTVQIAKAKENASLLFSGVRTGPLLEGAAKLFSFLDDSTIEGRALKALIETLLNPIFEGIGKAGPAAKQFFQGMIIGALGVAIAVLLVKKRIQDALGIKIDLGAVDWTALGSAVIYATVALIAVAAIIGLIAAVVIGSVVAVGLLGAAFAYLLVTIGAAIGTALGELPGAIVSIHNFLVSRAAAFIDIGAQFATGLAEGIRSGISEVVSAAIELATAPVDAVKQKLKIKSPSALARDEVGYQVAAGDALGMQDGIGLVEAAASDLGDAAGHEIANDNGGKSVGNRTLTIGTVNVYGVEGADDPAFVNKVTAAFDAVLMTRSAS